MAGALFLALGGCDSVSVWLSGVDRETYIWEPQLGNTHPASLDTSLTACLPPVGATQDPARFSIVRSEDSPAVTGCMADHGYRKSYQSRLGPF
ncbi:MAG TPA: hypothetical protein VN668_20145 [Stellaceae bacterium]|nr:hypothetical protein [Stellaceae bacterium]